MYFKRTGLFFALLLSLVLVSNSEAHAFKQCGKASWYAGPTNKTASGERLRHGANTAAHKTLPFGSKVRVTNRRNGRSIIVRINDRGPFIHGRIIDLTRGAASRLGFINSGVTNVCIKRIR
ncbi:MAG: septal ring lytic transglycosylase RlpA family protein [Rhizobiales bacterium]|nr:septal ring lytic transglycosylase RlpA family protein [Hyphomicrobiales bacterium]